MGTNFEASKPVLATYSWPVISVLTYGELEPDVEALDETAAGCASNVYPVPTLTVEH